MRTSKYVSQYLQATRNSNAANQMNFAGRDSRYANMTGNMSRFTGGNGSYFNAAGTAAPAAAAAQPMATPSHPYAITVSNSNASTVSNFVLFNGNVTPPGSTGWSGGNYSTGGVTVTGIYTTYQTLVSQSMTQPFTIGSTYVTAVNVNAQVQQSLTVNTTDASGLTQGVPIPFLKDPYQNQADTLVNNTPYRIDGTTSVTITALLAYAVAQYYFYPAQNINPASQLMGKDPNQYFQNPGLIRVLPVATGAQ